MKIYAENLLLNNDYIVGLSMKARMFNSVLKLGSTVCREINIDIEKTAIASLPSYFVFKNDSNVVLYKVYVDEVDSSNEWYYSFRCLDKMVQLNSLLDFGDGVTAQTALNAIVSEYSLGTAPVLAIGSQLVTYDGYTSARDFISYCAETEGCYAYIDASEHIVFAKLYDTPVASISLNDCSSFKLGLEHNITRVCYDDGINIYSYGDETGETLYLNTDNILYTDDSVYSIQDIVDAIGDEVIGLDVYNMEVEACPIANAHAGQIVTIGGYNTIVEEDYTFNGEWLGGYSLDLESSAQEETQVVDATERSVNSIRTEVNRQAGTIDIIAERTGDIETSLTHFQVAPEEVRITSQTANPPSSYAGIRGDGLHIYVDSEEVAEASSNRFNCNKGLGVQDWAIEQGNTSVTLNFFRKA